MASINTINPNAEVMRKQQALMVNVSAAKGMQEVLKTNLGPKGTLKMLVGGAGQIKITKDGNVLLHEMQIQHPTAALIARAATAQDDITGDGTTSTVLFCGDLLRIASRWVDEGVHPRMIVDGFHIAKNETTKFIEQFTTKLDTNDRETLLRVAASSLYTKLRPELADQFTEIVTDAVLTIRKEGQPIDLHMVERMHMAHRTATDSRLVKGLVMDHGARHPDMPKYLENCCILTCNVSLEYEKTEVNSGFFYSTAEEREKLVSAERVFTDAECRKIIDFKRRVCTPENGKNFVVINQKGIDPLSLDMMAKEGIIGIRRCKRRNAERLGLACGGYSVNSLEDLTEDCLGYAGKVYEHSIGDEKFTFVEDVRNPQSCTVLIYGPNPHTIAQLKDAVRDGLRAVKNALEADGLIAGGGAFELAAHEHLMEFSKTVEGKAKVGVRAYAEALLVIPKTLCENSGFDVMDTIISCQEALQKTKKPVGIDVVTGDPMDPVLEGVWDNVIVKKQIVQLTSVIASQLLLVDEVMRAGRKMGKDDD